MDMTEKQSFDFEAFKKHAATRIKKGDTLLGKDSVFTPLLKQFLEDAWGRSGSADHCAVCPGCKLWRHSRPPQRDVRLGRISGHHQSSYRQDSTLDTGVAQSPFGAGLSLCLAGCDSLQSAARGSGCQSCGLLHFRAEPRGIQRAAGYIHRRE